MTTNEINPQPISPRPFAVALWRIAPAMRTRLQRAVDIYKAGRVHLEIDLVLVDGEHGTYRVDYQLQSCLIDGGCCPDQAPMGLCKHRIAAGLAIAAHYELPAGRPSRLATAVVMAAAPGMEGPL